MTIIIGLSCFMLGFSAGVVFMGILIGKPEAEAPKPYGSHAEWGQ